MKIWHWFLIILAAAIMLYLSRYIQAFTVACGLIVLGIVLSGLLPKKKGEDYDRTISQDGTEDDG